MWNMWQKGDCKLSAMYISEQWIHGRCLKLKKVTPSVAKFFVCSKCDKATNGVVEVQQEIL